MKEKDVRDRVKNRDGEREQTIVAKYGGPFPRPQLPSPVPPGLGEDDNTSVIVAKYGGPFPRKLSNISSDPRIKKHLDGVSLRLMREDPHLPGEE